MRAWNSPHLFCDRRAWNLGSDSLPFSASRLFFLRTLPERCSRLPGDSAVRCDTAPASRCFVPPFSHLQAALPRALPTSTVMICTRYTLAISIAMHNIFCDFLSRGYVRESYTWVAIHSHFVRSHILRLTTYFTGDHFSLEKSVSIFIWLTRLRYFTALRPDILTVLSF